LIAKLDRLARNVAFVANLMDAGVELLSCDPPFASRLISTFWRPWLRMRPGESASGRRRLCRLPKRAVGSSAARLQQRQWPKPMRRGPLCREGACHNLDGCSRGI